MTLYTNFLPFKLVVRLFDSFLFESFKIIYRIGLTIIKIKEKKLLTCRNMDDVLVHLKNFEEPEFHDDDAFIDIAFGIKLQRKEIEVTHNFTLYINQNRKYSRNMLTIKKLQFQLLKGFLVKIHRKLIKNYLPNLRLSVFKEIKYVICVCCIYT